jgi:hypothetical protein
MTQKSKSVPVNLPLPPELIKRRIYIIRGQEVMLDSDLAELYQVSTGNLNLSVRRNLERFPSDFMFQLTKEEHKNLILQFAISNLRSQIVTSSYGGRRHIPYVFTEHGVAMLSSILKSKRAIAMNIFIIRAFIQLRKMLASHQELSKRLQKVERRVILHSQVLTGVVEDIKRIKNPPKTNAIGFQWKSKSKL